MSRRADRPGASIARQVRARGIKDPRVLDALSRVPRERFLPPDVREQALADRAVPIGFEQTISQPFMVGVMTLELALTGVERVLEVGTGSGYQTAILSYLAAEVFTVERLATLSLRARGILDGLGLDNVRFRTGDGSLGWPEAAPFDRIMITAGAPVLPPTLFSQLAEDGLLVVPLGPEEQQQLTVVRKQSGHAVVREVLPCRFVKLVGEEGWEDDHTTE
jgi:protein-L-isoaspartate(D-aspartate) O-methyltransferase